jgi:hypothetical protein
MIPANYTTMAEQLQGISDPQSRRGQWWYLLLLVASVMLAGQQRVCDMAQWREPLGAPERSCGRLTDFIQCGSPLGALLPRQSTNCVALDRCYGNMKTPYKGFRAAQKSRGCWQTVGTICRSLVM